MFKDTNVIPTPSCKSSSIVFTIFAEYFSVRDCTWMSVMPLPNSVFSNFRDICRKRFRKISEPTVVDISILNPGC